LFLYLNKNEENEETNNSNSLIKFATIDTSPVQLSRKAKFIKFSSDPVSREPIVNDFNKNIISLRLSRILDVQSASMLNYASDSFKCQKCAAFLNSFTEVKTIFKP